ncbi:MAG: IS1595 family transposase [Desulfovibrio sp.]|nr:IS1595 family transposase [Desulfovibrio sp.]
MDKISIVKQIFDSMSDNDKSEFLEYLKGKPVKSSKPFCDFKSLVIKHKPAFLPDRHACANCGSIHVVKNGHKDTAQRYLCRDCGRTFAITNNTLLYCSKKPVEVWEKYFECLMNKFSLRKCAAICGIDLSTAFIWRHKILDVLQKMQDSVTINGVAEADETFFHVSFKGDFKKSNFSLPREPHKRGTDVSLRGLSHEQACVPCIVNLDGLSIGKISNLGKPNLKALSPMFKDRIEKGSIFVTDGLRSYHKIAHDNELTHIRIQKGKHTNGAFNIQTVNAYHSELKRLVQRIFKGVATKYLNNYVVYHNFVNFAKGEFDEKMGILREFIYTTDTHIKSREISDRVRIPVLGEVA